MSTMKILWEFFLERGVTPIRGAVMVDVHATEDEISEIVRDAVAETISSRISWEREKPAKRKER
jgi:hypothetical protein